MAVYLLCTNKEILIVTGTWSTLGWVTQGFVILPCTTSGCFFVLFVSPFLLLFFLLQAENQMGISVVSFVTTFVRCGREYSAHCLVDSRAHSMLLDNCYFTIDVLRHYSYFFHILLLEDWILF